MNNCSQHKKEFVIETDQCTIILNMEQLAVAVKDLHYESLADFLSKLSSEIREDASKDRDKGRWQLARELSNGSFHIGRAYRICKRFMK